MKMISDNINDNAIYNQIIGLVKEFIEEQLQSNNIKHHEKRVVEWYLNLLKKISQDKDNNSKIVYIIENNEVIGIEIATTYYNRRDNAIIGCKECLFIKKEYRGQKVKGKYIALALDEIVEEFFNQKKVTIQRMTTLAGNQRQINVYKYLGYNVVAKRGKTVYLEKINGVGDCLLPY